MRVSVLGPVAVEHLGASVSGLALGGRRARVALVALTLASGPVPGERLARMIWGDEPPPSWKPALRGVIRSVRGAVATLGLGEQDLILTTPAGYALADSAASDVRELEAAVTHAKTLLRQSRPADAVTALEAPADTSADQLLPAEDADWVVAERRSITALRRTAQELMVTALGLAGDSPRAIRIASALVDADPTDERAHRTLMVAHDVAGDRVGAIQAYERCRAVLAEQLGIDPSGETVAAYLAALRSSAPTAIGQLPTVTGAFVGQERERASLVTALDHARLVTLTGRGGIGKSRLAYEVASGQREREVLWVRLGASADDELVAPDVARELGASVTPDPVGALIDLIAPRGAVLLVLDGCDDIVDGVASLVSSLHGGCPGLTVLCTSRRPLRLSGEKVLPLGPLDTADANSEQSVRLLTQRMIEEGRAPTDDPETGTLLAALAARSSGIPLAIELLAAQLRHLAPRDLLDDVSGEGDRSRDRLQSVIDYGYAGLTGEEATLFRRFSALSGSVGVALARAITSDTGIPPARVVRLLNELADRGLLAADRSGPRWRYAQHDDVRRYATELLQESGEDDVTFSQLANAIRALLPEDAKSPPGPFAASVTEVLPSIRSLFAAVAEHRASREDSLEIAFRLHRYWASTNVNEGRLWLGRLLESATPGPKTGLATFALGYLSYWAGDTSAALPALDSAVTMLRGFEDSYAARALMYLGGISDDLDHGAAAIEYLTECITISESLGDYNLQVGAIAGLGAVLAEQADVAGAVYATRAVALCRESGSAEQLVTLLPTAAMTCWQVGALEDAREIAAEAELLIPDDRRIARVILWSTQAALALDAGDHGAATDLATKADELGTELGVERELPLVRCLLALALLSRGDAAGAATATLSAITAAQTLSYSFPLALCLETSALVGSAIGAPVNELSRVLLAASAIRRRGNRSTPAPLQRLLHAPNEVLASSHAEALTDADAVALAEEILTAGPHPALLA